MKEILSQLRGLVEGKKKEHIRGGPAPTQRYYEKCIKRYPGRKEYCARVSWSIYCAHKNKGYKGCTGYGKKWGRPYSSPASEE